MSARRYRVADFEGYAVFIEHPLTARLPLRSGDVFVALKVGNQLYDMRCRPAEVVANFLHKMEGAYYVCVSVCVCVCVCAVWVAWPLLTRPLLTFPVALAVSCVRSLAV
jgi:hypothetical protein